MVRVRYHAPLATVQLRLAAVVAAGHVGIWTAQAAARSCCRTEGRKQRRIRAVAVAVKGPLPLLRWYFGVVGLRCLSFLSLQGLCERGEKVRITVDRGGRLAMTLGALSRLESNGVGASSLRARRRHRHALGLRGAKAVRNRETEEEVRVMTPRKLVFGGDGERARIVWQATAGPHASRSTNGCRWRRGHGALIVCSTGGHGWIPRRGIRIHLTHTRTHTNKGGISRR